MCMTLELSLSEPFSYLKAQATNHDFFIQQSGHSRTTGTEYNARRRKSNPEVTSVGYMPIIQAPGHELDSLNTVVKRTMHVASSFGQKRLVIVDQALFPQLMQLKLSVPRYRNVLIPRLGVLRIFWNFLKVISQDMDDSGLKVMMWIESDL